MSVNENPATSLIDPMAALGAMVVLMLQSPPTSPLENLGY